MLDRNAASVLPDPVGAMSSVLSPFLIAGQARACAGVGAAKDVRNHSRTAGWNGSSASLPMTRGYSRPTARTVARGTLPQLVRELRKPGSIDGARRHLVGHVVLGPAEDGRASVHRHDGVRAAHEVIGAR